MLINVSIIKKNENILVFNSKKCYNKNTYAWKRVDENEIKNIIIHKNNNNANTDRNIGLYRNNNV